ncbi:MAG: hypothetical protein ACTHLH_09730, partial [Solirubrobacterales bacterium]
VPICPPGNVESPPIQQRCKDAAIGGGRMILNIHLPEQPPVEARSELTAFNDGLRDGVQTISIVGDLNVPIRAEIIITVSVRRSTASAYKLKLVGSVPKIAGGSGSITYLGLRFRKGVFSARCVKRHLAIGFGAELADGSLVRGGTLRSCTPSP